MNYINQAVGDLFFMKRLMNADELDNLQTYTESDMVRIGCSDCSGCSQCCRNTGDTIILDPYDIYNLEIGLHIDFAQLLSGGRIELNCYEGVILPHLKIRENQLGCTFLNEEGRCSIHDIRPGFCRLFPLGRIYDSKGFRYFVQSDECPHPGKSKVRIRQWLEIADIVNYEKFVYDFHNVIKDVQAELAEHPEAEKEINLRFLQKYYFAPFDTGTDFFTQYFRNRIL